LRELLLLATAIVGVAVFGLLAWEVTHASAITGFDAQYFAIRQRLATPDGQRAFAVITALGSPAFLTVLAVIGAVWLGGRRWSALAVGWVSAFVGSALLVELTKRTIHEARPSGAAQFLHGASYSFPSGHVVGSVVGYGMVAYVLGRVAVRHTLTRMTTYGGAACLVASIAWSRIYLGVHFVSDVLGGLALGSAWLMVCVLGMERLCRHHAEQRDRPTD